MRIACIDAPELGQEPYGRLSTDVLTGLVVGRKSVSLNIKGNDGYGRIVAEVFRGRLNVGLAMVQRGHAFVYDDFIGQCDGVSLQKAEARARDRGRGVWSSASLEKPWDYRRGGAVSGPEPSPEPEGDPGPVVSPPITSGVTPYTGSRVITCSQISSRELARQWLLAGHSYLDADGDGCACESQFPC